MLKGNAQERKAQPIFSGLLRYFPDALAAVAELSRIGNEQHNPGKPLHWDRSKSGDELDALARHLVDAGEYDTDDVLHDVKVAWRGLSNLQKTIEGGKPGIRKRAENEAETRQTGLVTGPLSGAQRAPLETEGGIPHEVSSDAPEATPVAARVSLNLVGVGDLTFEIFGAEGQTYDGPLAEAVSTVVLPPIDPDVETPELQIRRTSEDAPFFRPLSDYRR